MATSPGLLGDGLSQADTSSAVTEVSADVVAQQNTFTPFGTYKEPMVQKVNMRGKSVTADIDMGNPSEWQYATASEVFLVGFGASDGSASSSGVYVELRYNFGYIDGPHVEARLRGSATGAWMDCGVYDPTAVGSTGSSQVKGTYRVRIDLNSAGSSATMTVTPSPYLNPAPTGIYNDITDTETASVSGNQNFRAGFWTSGTPGTARAAARIVRMYTNAGDDLTMTLKSTRPYITSALGASLGATAQQTTEFHLLVSNFTDELVRGFQAFWLYDQTDWGYNIYPTANINTSTIENQSYADSVDGPFVYPLSPFIFDNALINEAADGSFQSNYGRLAAGEEPATPSLNTDAELAEVTVGPPIPDPLSDSNNGLSGGAINLPLVGLDPDGGILGNAGFTLDGGALDVAHLRGSDTVIVDETKPEADFSGSCSGVTEGTTNLIPSTGPEATAYEGTVVVDFFAEDHGDYGAPTGSGLGATPQAIVQYWNGSTWVNAFNGIVFPDSCGDNQWEATWNITNDTPCGQYRVEVIATDRVGLTSSTTTENFTVQTLKEIDVTLTLHGLLGNPNANNQRLIEFEIGSAQGTPLGIDDGPKTEIYQLVRFTAGQATVKFIGGVDGVPSCDADNLVIWAKDEQHTIAASDQLNGIGTIHVGSVYSATLDLYAGDVNNDNVVNFADYALFVSDYGKLAPKDMTSMIWYRNCDLNGSGQVDFADWILFYPNFGKVGAAEPGDYISGHLMTPGRGGVGIGSGPTNVNIHDPHLTRMPVKQLVSMGIKDAPAWDTNHDGWVDMTELYQAMLKKRH
ncbi:MAG: hypothetical protein ACYC96_03680 [Fimbriimonadaceae bacterium]